MITSSTTISLALNVVAVIPAKVVVVPSQAVFPARGILVSVSDKNSIVGLEAQGIPEDFLSKNPDRLEVPDLCIP